MLGDLIALLVVGGGLAFLAWTAFVDQYRPHHDGYVCRSCREWQTTSYGCSRCERVNHPSVREQSAHDQ